MQPFTLDVSRAALIVVDMQNDFVRVGAPMEVPDARATIATHQRLLDTWREHHAPIIYTRFIAGLSTLLCGCPAGARLRGCYR